MGNLLFTSQTKQSSKERLTTEVVNNNINDSSITPNTKPLDPNEMAEHSTKHNTTHTEHKSTISSIVTTTSVVERCRGCDKSNVQLYTRGMMQIRVCGDCVDG